MRRRNPSTDDRQRGSAPVEFIGVGLILLVPLVYLILALGTIQHQTLGAEAAARHSARAIAQAPDTTAATSRANAVIASVAREYGIDRAALSVEITCTPVGARCPEADATLHVRVSTRVTLPFMPPLFGLADATSIPLDAESVQKLPRRWGR